MVQIPGQEANYEVASQWRERCLEHDMSLLWPDETAWSIQNLKSASKLFEQVGSNRKDYWTELALLLAEEPASVQRIAADMCVIYNVAPSWTKLATKREALQPLRAGLGDVASSVISIVETAFERGIMGVSKPYLTKNVTLPYLADFAIRVKQGEGAVADPATFQVYADATLSSRRGGVQARHVILHLLFPNDYEAIPEQNQKRQIVLSMGKGQSLPSDTDAALRAIRERYELQLGRPGFSFYADDVRRLWEVSTAPVLRRYWWVNQGKTYVTERDGGYIYSGGVNIQGHQVKEHQRMKEMGEGDLILHYHASAVQAVGIVSLPITDKSKGTELRVEVQYHPLEDPIGLSELPSGLRLKSTGPFNSERGINQGYLYELDASRMARFARTFADRLPGEIDFPIGPGVSTNGEIGTLGDVCRLSHLDEREIAEIESLLIEKKQIIFEGPPGSGKTFLADLFARYFTENPLDGEHDERIEVVQFHQSYGYEDFVQGIRPVTDGEGRLQYRVMPGIFLQHCERARANPEKRFVLIIDEINRGNLSRIFGELLMLLEYRDKKARLPYAAGDGVAEQSHLQIPLNLYLIGTMNSTDRSLAMIDYALRRRFFFYRLLPVVDGQATVLERWLAAQDFTAAQRDRVLAYFVRINQEIGTQLSADFQIGHSYFMVADIAEHAVLDRVWRRALRPLLEEYFHTARGVDEIIKALEPTPAQILPPAPEASADPDHADDSDDTDA